MAIQPCVYILSNKRHGALYIGVTGNLMQRIHQHRNPTSKSFTARYRVYRLVRYEFLGDMPSAIAREKQLKNWHREWKINLIEQDNPHWLDLAVDWGFEPVP